MPEFEIPWTIVGGVLILLLLVLLIAGLFSKNYVKIPSNQVGVFTGRGKQKTVRGGARLRIPLIERVDIMSLEPFNVEVKVENVYSKNGVPVNVTGVAMVRFGSTENMLTTAVERFLTSNRTELQEQVREILAGNMRGVVSQMTVEDLNTSRDELTRRVSEEASSSFEPIGMELNVLTIQNISDNNGYLDALGQARIAEVKRDAQVGAAEARRDTRIKSAEADRLGAVAEAIATTAKAQAEEERDRELAQIRARIDGENAKAAQAGPKAEALARAEVEKAQADADGVREEARIAVERQRAARAEEAARADIIVPAEARKKAAILDAEGKRQADVEHAEAAAKAKTLEGQADADARTALAAAQLAEMKAEAEGEEARLRAQAEGQRELAEALNTFSPVAVQLQLTPQLIAQLPEMANAIAAHIGQIDKMVVVDGGGGSNGEGGDIISKLTSTIPLGVAAVMETIKTTSGIDLGTLAKSATGVEVQPSNDGQSAEVVTVTTEEPLTN